MTRAMRIVADHSRGAAFLIADGVVPSNEDRGYILRRIMRRAIQQGNTLGLEAPWLGRFAERTIELMGEAYPELVAERETIARWVDDEEESFGRTLERGTELLERLIVEAKESETSWIDAADAFKLHDTYGFPYDLTKELLAERGARGRRLRLRGADGGAAHSAPAAAPPPPTAPRTRHEKVIAFAATAPPTRFVGYETLRATHRPRRRPGRRRPRPGQARGEPLLRRGRRPGRRLRRAALGRRGGEGRSTSTGSAKTRRSRSSRAAPRSSRGSRSRPWSTARPATRRCATTPPPTSCTRPCASGSAPTCARPAPPSAPTSCASTSPTARR